MNENSQRKQKRLRMALVAVICVVFLVVSFFIVYGAFEPTSSQITYTSAPQLPMDNVDPKEIWVSQIRSENEVVHEKVDFIQDMFKKRVTEEKEKEDITKKEIDVIKKQLETLVEERKNMQAVLSTIPSKETLREELQIIAQQKQQPLFDQTFPAPPSNMPQTMVQEFFSPLVSITCPEPAALHHIDRTIPTGTTVKAILLSSVDMPCGVKGSSDPLPVKLRIIADGHLPHGVRARLKSGIVTASVFGDLSSERLYFRLEKLTQMKADGHYIETQVAGYISGEDGKYGLRGTIVDKSTILIENALISGFFSGASNFFQAAAASRLFPVATLNGIPAQTVQPGWGQTAGQLAIAGGSEGVGNAMDALTDYFIKRAEQLRPVIQVSPGRIVDITFSDSADLGDLYTHERVRNSGKGVACGP